MKEKLLLYLSSQLKFPETDKLQQRGIADKIEADCVEIIKANFSDVKPARSRKSVEDVTVDGCYVDIKTSDTALTFKMPNLISVIRLVNLDKPLYYVFISYNSEEKQILGILVIDVYELNWDHLQVQNLGVGQLQIVNMNKFMQSPSSSITKEQWLCNLKNKTISFYDKLIKKTEARKKKIQNS
jgi:hypothetical protein